MIYTVYNDELGYGIVAHESLKGFGPVAEHRSCTNGWSVPLYWTYNDAVIALFKSWALNEKTF